MNTKKSLQFKIMSSVNLTVVALIIAFSSSLYFKNSTSMEKTAHQDIKAFINSIKLAASISVKQEDKNFLKVIGKQLIDDPAIDKVIIYNNKNEELAKVTGSQNSDSFHGGILNETIYDHETNLPIGKISIEYNLNEIREFKHSTIQFTIMSIILMQIILAIVLMIVIRYTNKEIKNEVHNLKEMSDKTLKISNETSEVAQQVSQATTEEAAAVQETVSTLHEITEMAKSSMQNINLSTQKANDSYKSAEDGKRVVSDVIDSMKEINQSNSNIINEVNHSNEKIKEIISVINEISAKTTIINDIVFQTKLLSFNASVEAARAGEHGKGFAVVAEEVGNLAIMSGKASNEISELLNQSVQKVNNIVEDSNSKIASVLKKGEEKVESGIKVAHKCETVLNDIVNNANELKLMMNEIASSSNEQSTAVANILTAISQIDQMVHTNEVASNKAFSSSQAMAFEANNIKNSIQNIQIALFGKELKDDLNTTSSQNNKILNLEPSRVISSKKTTSPQRKLDKTEIKKQDQILKFESKKTLSSSSKANSKPISNVKTSNGDANALPSHNDTRFEDV